MGTTIYNSFSEEYRKKFYGAKFIPDYEVENNIKLKPHLETLFSMKNKICIDHLTLDNLLGCGILNQEDIQKYDCVCIVREPIERFISMYNYEHLKNNRITLQEFIDKMNYYSTQCYMLDLKHEWNVIKIKFTNIRRIEETFKKYGIIIDLSKTILNKTPVKAITINDISPVQMDYIVKFFKRDFDLYNSLCDD
jgi:hypothetical protein